MLKKKSEVFITNLIFATFPDVEAPVLLCPANQTTETTPGQPTSVVSWNEPQATDNSGQSLNVTCSVKCGSQFDIGLTYVICEAYDPSGNQAMCNFIVEVQGKNWTDFLF